MVENKKQGVKVLSEFMGFSKPFMSSWDALMQVVEKLEALDLSDKMYSWEDDMGKHYNFWSIDVEICSNMCWISIELSLDPCIFINRMWIQKQTNLDGGYTATKLDSVFYSCVEAVEYLKENNLI